MLRIKLYSIFVDDQTKALRFYTEVLGLREGPRDTRRRVPLADRARRRRRTRSSRSSRT